MSTTTSTRRSRPDSSTRASRARSPARSSSKRASGLSRSPPGPPAPTSCTRSAGREDNRGLPAIAGARLPVRRLSLARHGRVVESVQRADGALLPAAWERETAAPRGQGNAPERDVAARAARRSANAVAADRDRVARRPRGHRAAYARGGRPGRARGPAGGTPEDEPGEVIITMTPTVVYA